jgi:hypothetical protein
VETPIGVQWRQAREICRANARPNWKEQPPWRRSPAYNGARPERSLSQAAPGPEQGAHVRSQNSKREPRTGRDRVQDMPAGAKLAPLPRSQVGAIHPKAMPMILRTEQERGWCGRCSVAAAATVRIVGYRPQRLCREAVGGIGFWHGRGRCGRFGRLGPGVFCGRGTADSPEATDPTAGPSCSNPTSLSWPRPASRSGLPYRRASWRRAVPRYG